MNTSSRTIIWVIAAAVLAFLAGFGWQYARADRLDERLTNTTRLLTESRIEASLATALIDAQQGNYELARQRASEFFTGLGQQQRTLGADAPPKFASLLPHRDATITMLSRSSPDAVELLRRLYTEYRTGAKPGGGRVPDR